MIELVAAHATLVVVLSAITGLVLLLGTAVVAWVFFTAFGDYESNVRDVQRFIELTEEARSLLPEGLPLLDPEKAAATTAAIGRFSAKKEEARRALWQPRTRRVESTAPATHARSQPSSEPSGVGPRTGQAR
jgi:hypothetical protein